MGRQQSVIIKSNTLGSVAGAHHLLGWLILCMNLTGSQSVCIFDCVSLLSVYVRMFSEKINIEFSRVKKVTQYGWGLSNLLKI